MVSVNLNSCINLGNAKMGSENEELGKEANRRFLRGECAKIVDEDDEDDSILRGIKSRRVLGWQVVQWVRI